MPWREVRGDGPWRRWAIVVLLAGAAATTAGAAVTWRLYRHSEERLLHQQTREAAAVLTAAVGRVETTLSNSVVLADATSGDRDQFEMFATSMAEGVGFAGAQLVGSDGSMIAAGGAQPLVGPAERTAAVDALVERARTRPGAIHIALIEGSQRRLAYAVASTADPTGFVVYAEAPLPDPPTGLSRSDGPFSDIDYGLYLGSGERPDTLLYTSTDTVPLPGPTSVVEIEFGDTGLTFAARSATPLAGRFAQAAPWVLAVSGALGSVLAALGTRSVIRRGRAAEQLAARLAQISAQQQAGIETLRSSLLPRRLVTPPGVAIHTGYWPADRDHEISGDFYDAFQVDQCRWALVIGDVCGKGAEAAALTGLTRHTIRAAARHLREPDEVLRWTHEAIAAYGAATYVTACFGFVEADDDTLTLRMALGGHPLPVLWRNDEVRPIGTPGTLLGIVAPRLTTTTTLLVPGDVVVLYTDGLTDTAEAPLDLDALGEIMGTALRASPPEGVPDELHAELQRRRPGGSSDDSAVLVVHVTGITAGAAGRDDATFADRGADAVGLGVAE